MASTVSCSHTVLLVRTGACRRSPSSSSVPMGPAPLARLNPGLQRTSSVRAGLLPNAAAFACRLQGGILGGSGPLRQHVPDRRSEGSKHAGGLASKGQLAVQAQAVAGQEVARSAQLQPHPSLVDLIKQNWIATVISASFMVYCINPINGLLLPHAKVFVTKLLSGGFGLSSNPILDVACGWLYPPLAANAASPAGPIILGGMTSLSFAWCLASAIEGARNFRKNNSALFRFAGPSAVACFVLGIAFYMPLLWVPTYLQTYSRPLNEEHAQELKISVAQAVANFVQTFVGGVSTIATLFVVGDIQKTVTATVCVVLLPLMGNAFASLFKFRGEDNPKYGHLAAISVFLLGAGACAVSHLFYIIHTWLHPGAVREFLALFVTHVGTPGMYQHFFVVDTLVAAVGLLSIAFLKHGAKVGAYIALSSFIVSPGGALCLLWAYREYKILEAAKY